MPNPTHLRAGAALAAVATSFATAGIVNHQWSGVFSGTFAGSSFTNLEITFVATIETGNRTEVDGSPIRIYQNNHLAPTTVDIGGLGTYAMIYPTRSFATETGLIGLGRIGGGDYFGIDYGSAGAEWDMQVSVGPLTSTQWSLGTAGPIETIGGLLVLTSNSTPVSFVSGVPAPGAIALLGLAGIVGRRRR